MKRGTLKKDDNRWKIYTEGKGPLLIAWFTLPDSLNNQVVEYDNSGGQVKLIKYDGIEYLQNEDKKNEAKYKNLKMSKHQNNDQNIDSIRKPANAPYNFIPLNTCIVSDNTNIPISEGENITQSGFIDLTITNKTPFFIRGRDVESNEQGESFFHINTGEPVIPGSSLRGLIRNLVEIISWSSMEFVDKDVRLFHRGMLDPATRLKAEYKKERPVINMQNAAILETNKKSELVGILKYVNDKYLIYPSSCLGSCSRNTIGKVYKFNTSWWEVSPDVAPQQNNKGWKIGLPSQDVIGIEIDKKLINHYNEDKNRGPKVPNIIECARSPNKFKIHVSNDQIKTDLLEGVPIFYQIEGSKITSFGYCRNYRIPYTKKIGDHIIQHWNDLVHQIDFTTSIFGSLKQSTRVFFEDSTLSEDVKFLEKVITTPLMSPKPTTFQHYIKQPKGYNTLPQELVHWGDEGNISPIRGYKNYWHRDTSIDKTVQHSWVKTDQIPENYNVTNMNQIPIKVLMPGASFTQRIRFEKLSKIELGCLLFALSLPEDCCHKLGLGKPLGLGSIEIGIITVAKIEPNVRYSKLFDNKNWFDGINDITNDVKNYKNCFAKYMGANLKEVNILDCNTFWAEKGRMKHLKTMLTFKENNDRSNWLDRTRYLKPIEFKNRPVLPTPLEVISIESYKKNENDK